MPDATDDVRTWKPSTGALIVGALAMSAVTVTGILLLGRLADTDVTAMALTTGFFLVLAGVILIIARRNRSWLLPLGIPFALVAVISGALLGRPLLFDDVVNEDIVTAEASTSGAADTTPSGNVAVASGAFGALAHPGTGEATLIRTPDDGVQLTFTSFETDNGPDLRVYLSRDTQADGTSDSFIDLGALKGNKGDQQYSIPDDVDLSAFDAVVVWCRAFDVGFTQAPLSSEV